MKRKKEEIEFGNALLLLFKSSCFSVMLNPIHLGTSDSPLLYVSHPLHNDSSHDIEIRSCNNYTEAFYRFLSIEKFHEETIYILAFIHFLINKLISSKLMKASASVFFIKSLIAFFTYQFSKSSLINLPFSFSNISVIYFVKY